ncbi:MAG TPA: hypothetical protein ENG87_00490 [Candidatus Pacearchaeota archaeon]|nr:hypothetical protein BMS3Abin17_00086 [archaeon BMS3Abin17]HDK41826.1 hypothetical protein [Candidatus Pacearchaeota archaeon]HDZ60166.1 hypothetical protein [Candidatus Pacearchaeota archaeon]
MNEKATMSIFFGLMLAILLFFLGLALAPALQDVTTEAGNAQNLNCSTINSTHPDYNTIKPVCTSIDIQQLFIGIIFGLAGLVVWRAT